MLQPTLVTLFSGGGLFDVGAKQAGYKPIYGIELVSEFADAYGKNLGSHIECANVFSSDFDCLQHRYVEHLHASPVCKNVSGANAYKGETPNDLLAIESTLRAISVAKPNTITIENVPAYTKTGSFGALVIGLSRLGYRYVFNTMNTADFGVPQARKRLILVASKISEPSLPMPTHAPTRSDRFMKWVSWYEEIQDLIPNLKPTKLASWQKDRLGDVPRQPCLIPKDGAPTRNKLNPRPMEQPCLTLRALGGDGHWQQFILAMPTGDAGWGYYTLSTRALARLQTLPDNYILPYQNRIACQIIGNGVPCAFSRAIMQHIYNGFVFS